MTTMHLLTTSWLIFEYIVKIVAVGWVPENRRPASSQSWLLLIFFLPVLGLPLYLLIGSPYVKGRRHRIQAAANQLLALETKRFSDIPDGVEVTPGLASLLGMNRRLTSLPCVTGINDGFFGDTVEAYEAMAEAVDQAHSYVHVEFYIMSWDDTTDRFFTALADAVSRGVDVRLLMDHLGSRGYPGWRKLRSRLTKAGIQWHLLMPINLLRGRWRRPDLRNHRKLLVVDGEVGFVGSHNVIDPHYGSARNRKIGRRWKDLSVRVRGDIIRQLDAVFAVDWFTETGRRLHLHHHSTGAEVVPRGLNAMQLVPSGPGFPTEPNQRMFAQLIATATERVGITSPYFVPDESLLHAITTACYRGVRIDLFVSEKADQFLVGHAQRSYYRGLLEAGVHIYLYPAPTILHSKFLIVDDQIGAVGSSNMDYRSFSLDYEVMLLGFGGDLVEELRTCEEEYRQASVELTLEEWLKEPLYRRYLDNVAKLASAVM